MTIRGDVCADEEKLAGEVQRQRERMEERLMRDVWHRLKKNGNVQEYEKQWGDGPTLSMYVEFYM